MSLSSLDDDLDEPLNLLIGILKENQSNKAHLQENNDVLKKICFSETKASESLKHAVDENNRQKDMLQDLMLDGNPQLQKLEFGNISLRADVDTLKERNEALEDTLKELQEKNDALQDKLRETDILKESNNDLGEKLCILQNENEALIKKTKCVDNLKRENVHLQEDVTQNERLKVKTVTDLREKLTKKDQQIEVLQRKCQTLEENETILLTFQAENAVLKQTLSELDSLQTDNLKLVEENKSLRIKVQAVCGSQEPENLALDDAKRRCDILQKEKYVRQEKLENNESLDDVVTNIGAKSQREPNRRVSTDVEIEPSNTATGLEMQGTRDLDDIERMLASAVEEDNTDSWWGYGKKARQRGIDERLRKAEDEGDVPLHPDCDKPSVEALRIEHNRTVAELRQARDVMSRSLKDIQRSLP